MGTALVTGGARGIGRDICKALATAGFDIANVSLETDADASAAMARGAGANGVTTGSAWRKLGHFRAIGRRESLR